MAVDFVSLESADLVVDEVYEGGQSNHLGAEPLPRLLSVKASGGIRYLGSAGRPSMVVLTTTGRSADWPDSLDSETGIFTYYGDNRRPGRELHKTPIRGNEVLRHLFEAAATEQGRANFPPVLVFSSTGERRNQRFLGLAVPGVRGIAPLEELVAIWRSSGGERYQNYRGLFTILDAPNLSRAWLNSVISGGTADTIEAPAAWRKWIKTGVPAPLIAPRTREVRTLKEQEPTTGAQREVLNSIYGYFSGRPHDFEHFAAHLVQLYLPMASEIEVTRPSRDGGRDAIGKYRLGTGLSRIEIDFAVEAKCYSPTSGVGVKQLSRLISRLRHRQFGILVTTSYLDRQAYAELKEDRHPIIVLSGRDIVELLLRTGVTAQGAIQEYIESILPAASPG